MERELSPEIRIQTMRTINSMLEKIKDLQTKYEESVIKIQRENEERIILQDKVNELNDRLMRSQKQTRDTETLLINEKEKNIDLEKHLIAAESKVFLLERKYQNVKALENECDDLTKENTRLLNTSTELESALEACQRKIHLYELKISVLDKCLRNVGQENKINNEKEGLFRDNMFELNEKWQDVKEDLNKLKESYDNSTEKLISLFTACSKEESRIKIPDIKNHQLEDNFDYCASSEPSSPSKKCSDQNRIALQQLLQETIDQKSRLRDYGVQFMNHETVLQKMHKLLLSLNNKLFLKKTRSRIYPRRFRLSLTFCRRNIRKYIRVMRRIIGNLKNQINHQEILRLKWKNILNEIITNFETRINSLRKVNEKLKKNNLELEYVLQTYEII